MSETRHLASFIVNSRYEDIPHDVRHEAARSIVNYMGVTLGGSVDPAVDIPAMEQEILKLWRETKTFEEAVLRPPAENEDTF